MNKIQLKRLIGECISVVKTIEVDRRVRDKFENFNEVKKTSLMSLVKEEIESSVSKNIKAEVDSMDSYLQKPENSGLPFTQDEIQAMDTTEFKPDSKTTTQVRYSAPDELSNKNKELVIIKKQGRYLAFYSISEPVDLTAGENPEDIDLSADAEKTVVVIKVSKPFKTGQSEDVPLLTNFITELVSEYQLQ